MSLQVWLPLNGDLHNQGLKQYNLNLFRGSEVYNNNGKIGKCFYANGVNTIKILNIIPDFYNYAGYSLCAWFYIEGQNTSHSGSAIISAGNWNAQVLNLSISDWSSDHYTRLRISGTNWNNTYAYNFQKNVWYHVVVSSDGNKTYAYVNGNLLGNTAVGFLPTNIEGNDICIGGATYYAGMQFFGRINDVRIYNHCLSTAEVEEISKSLILHYQLNQPNENLIKNEIYSLSPWSDAIQAHEIYQGKFAYRITNNILYSKTGNGANNIFPNIIYSENTQYTMSVDWRDDYRTDNKSSSLYLRFHYTDGTSTQIISPANSKKEWTHSVLISAAGKTVDKCTTTYGNGGQLYLTNLKLEKGIIETPFIFNDSNIIYDSSGYNHNGTITGQLEIAQPSPKFNGATYINSPDPTTNSTTGEYYILADCGLTTPSTMSVAWWANPESGYGNTINHAMWCTTTLDTGADYQASAFNHRDAGFDVNSSDNTHLRLSTASFVANEWHHYVVTYDGQTAKLYKDGTQQSSVAFSAAKTLGSFTKVIIGHSRAGSVHRKMKGKYSDFRIYATALTAAQVKDLYRTSMIVDGAAVRPRDLE